MWIAATRGLVMRWTSRWIGFKARALKVRRGVRIWDEHDDADRQEGAEPMGGGGRPSNTRACEKRRREKISFVDSVFRRQAVRLRLRFSGSSWGLGSGSGSSSSSGSASGPGRWTRKHTRRLPPFPFGYNSTATNTSSVAVAPEHDAHLFRPLQTAPSAPRQLLFPIFLIGPAACPLHADRSVCMATHESSPGLGG